MRVVCAWCRAEGKPALLREIMPLEDTAETHGVCRYHQLALLADVAKGDQAERAAGTRHGSRTPNTDRELRPRVIAELRKELRAVRAENAALIAARGEALAILRRHIRDAATHGRAGVNETLRALEAALMAHPHDTSYSTTSESF